MPALPRWARRNRLGMVCSAILWMLYLQLRLMSLHHPLGNHEEQQQEDRQKQRLLDMPRHIAPTTNDPSAIGVPWEGPKWAIFYNIFIPTDQGDEGIQNAKRIVKEQIVSVRRSYAASIRGKTLTLFYNTIGKSNAITTPFMNEACEGYVVSKNMANDTTAKPVHCKHVQHYDQAFEEVTLQELHDFCASRPNFRVTYLHSKGSYHDHKDRRNEYWRQHGTLAATSKGCIHPPNATCNLCGLQFWTYWTHFMPGNFWTAHCSYINKLVQPLEFEQRMNEVTQKALALRAQGLFETALFTGRDDHFGVERYASEHWAGSHPDLVPCDLSRTGSFGHWIKGPYHGSTGFQYAMAPRHRGSPVGEELGLETAVLFNQTKRTREYFLLAGRLFRWFHLYNAAPPASSWIWRWFPDGEMWKQAVGRFGNQAVEQLISNPEFAPVTFLHEAIVGTNLNVSLGTKPRRKKTTKKKT